MHSDPGTAALSLSVITLDTVASTAEHLTSGYLRPTGAGRRSRCDGRKHQVSVKGVELHPGFCELLF